MATARTKANTGLTLVIFFIITLITGIVLHLKAHGTVIQPRGVIKAVHTAAGLLMAVFTCLHGIQFKRILSAMKSRFRWFWGDTWVVIIFTAATVITGLVKLLSPVKIPHLGLWHYVLGLIMTIAIIVHLVRGIPSWNRLRKIK